MGMRGVNKVILVGRLGQDPDVRYTPNGNAVTNISVATSESWKDKNTNQTQEKTEWHKVVFFGKLAEIAGEYLRSGSQIYIEGKLKTDKFQDKGTGQDRYSTSINVDSFSGVLQMLGDGSASNNQNNNGQNQQVQPQQAQNQQTQNQQAQPQQQYQQPVPQQRYQHQPSNNHQGQNNQQPPNPAPVTGDFDDDIPF